VQEAPLEAVLIPTSIYTKFFSRNLKQDTTYIRKFDHLFSPRVRFGTKFTTFGFGDAPRQIDRKRYYPNVSSTLGLGLFYSTVGVQFGFLLQTNNAKRDSVFGNTEYFDLEFRIYKVKSGFSVNFQNYKGFYIATPPFFGNPAITLTDPYFQRPDIRVRNTALSYFTIQNWEKFSMQAAFQNTKHQRKSAGSFMFMGHMQYLTIKGDTNVNTSLTSKIAKRENADTVVFTRGRFLGVNPRVGYGHTLVYKNLYLTGVYFLGPGLQYQSIKKTEGGVDHFYSPYLGSSFWLAFGYNGKRFFTSYQLIIDNSRNFIEGIRLQAQTNSNTMLVGYRF
jgi:hypothetical protein